jgi:hypothetical protein
MGISLQISEVGSENDLSLAIHHKMNVTNYELLIWAS